MYTKPVFLSMLSILLLFLTSNNALIKEDTPAAKTVKMSVLPGLRFDVPRFHVQPGQKVVIEFENTDDMDHNLLIINPGTREKIVELAGKLGAQGMAKSYVPESKDILWHTKILHAGQKEKLVFIAPSVEGVYPYVCTFPGHGHVMYGAIYVNKSGKMPELAKDPHLPELSKQSEHQHHHKKNHPYEPKAPYHYRIYMEGASPAAVAVHLPGQISYCWDAAVCDLRYIWQGEFLDNTAIWKGHKDAKAKILGDIFYKQANLPSIAIASANSPNKGQFKGYRVLKDKYLEFHYQIDKIDIYETIKETGDRKGIIRTFRIPDLKADLTFQHSLSTGMKTWYKGAPLQNTTLKLSSAEAKEFTLEYKIED